MTLYNKISQAHVDKNVTTFMNLLDEDFIFVFHKLGNSSSKSQWGEMLTGMFNNDKFVQHLSRCI